MATDALTDFPNVYVKAIQRIGRPYGDDEFLYPHDPPWPQEMFDYPYGMAPPIDEIPADEERDWQQHVGNYYLGIARNLATSPSTNGLVSMLEQSLATNGLTGYADIPVALFLSLLTEGLYSKFLSMLDLRDNTLFDVPTNDGYQYLKSDYSCMRVVTPWPNEYVRPSIAVVRRRAGAGPYQLYKVAVAPKGGDLWNKQTTSFFTPGDTSNAYRIAKYFVLQGAIHRINLIDHVRVHFAHEVVNGVTKSVLPRWHLLQQLLMPHFWLTLPVNNAVLEGPRSLINRDTWYPWSPFAARGDQIRRLLPFSWAGNQYYFKDANQSYPAGSFSSDPKSVTDWRTGQVIPTFVGLKVSLYSAFQADYWKPIRDFVYAVVQNLPNPPTTPALHDDQVWLEIQHWAFEIGKYIPGFPTWMAICNRDTLADAVTMIIWNAAIVHSADHGTLHRMMSDPTKPVPFVLRVDLDQGQETIGDVLGAAKTLVKDVLRPYTFDFGGGLKITGQQVYDILVTQKVTAGQVPLCQPLDLVWAQMADLLFYLPHNSSLLCEVSYEFTSDVEEKKIEGKWTGRSLNSTQIAALKQAQATFNQALAAVDAKYFGGNVVTPAEQWGFPRLNATGQGDSATFKITRCIGAGIQY